MLINFYKYQGTGNDFVMIDDRSENFDINDHDLVEKLCDRRFGIGGDGLILLRNHDSYDFEMVYFNSDGHQSSMCGNGGRCIVRFANHLGVIKDKTEFMAIDGLHEALVEEDVIHLKMKDVADIEIGDDYFYLDTGSPHYVTFQKNLLDFDLVNSAKKIRYNERFSQVGTNVNFIEHQSDNVLKIRTYERGVEGETLSCGTGVTASAIAANLKGIPSPVQLNSMGGIINVAFDKIEDKYQNIFLIGPAELVFEGNIDTENLK